MVFGKKNMDRGRYALVRITANHDWLTCDGDEPEDTGWKEIEDALDRKKVLPLYSTHNQATVELTFIEWSGEDEAE